MGTIAKQLLSGSTNGRQIKVVATTTPGTTIHTAVSGTADLDEVWIWAVNTDTATRSLTIEFGGTSSPDDTIEVDLEAGKGLYLVIPGWLLQNALLIRAFASVANVVLVGGFVNRITA